MIELGRRGFLGVLSAVFAPAVGAKARCAGERFEIYSDKAGEWRWTLHAANGEPIAQHEGYTSRSECLRSVERIRAAASTAEIAFRDICETRR